MTSGDPAHGKELFLNTCGACHTLADAKTTGAVGPNLDDAFASDIQQGYSRQDIRDIVRGQIAYPEKPMPANLYRGQDAADIAVYVAQCTGNPNCGVQAEKPAPPSGAGGTTTTTPGGGQAGGGGAGNGKQIFETAGCAGCHTLKNAGSHGNVGPNLDQLKPPYAIVKHQVEVGGGPMPAFKGRLTPAQIDAVAKYVSSVAGK
ncbi:MAG TPA: c-type cytochrome [Gaiellaceae bacterium]|nr:c-type cytochrome [Gaiellaceae bacterium]